MNKLSAVLFTFRKVEPDACGFARYRFAKSWLTRAIVYLSCLAALVSHAQSAKGFSISWMHPELGSSRQEKWKDVLSPEGEIIESQNGQLFWVGRSRSRPVNWQYMIFGEDTTDDVLVRFDLNDDQPHVNIQIGRDLKGKHTSVKPGDKVVVEVKDGKVRVTVNGELKDEISVSRGVKPGSVELDKDGTVRIRDGNGQVVTEHAPDSKPQDEKDNADGEVQAKDDSKSTAHLPNIEPLINVPHEADSGLLINVPHEPDDGLLINVPQEPDNKPLINVPPPRDDRPLINVPLPPDDIRKQWFLSAGARWKNHPVMDAALAGDWYALANLLESITPEQGDAVQRHLKGHALLAINRNNDSFRLFATATSEDLMVWEMWTSGLAELYPGHSYAHFYRADALARLGKHEEAIAAFTKAIELDSENACALHGRGVLYAQLRRFSEAGTDLAAAQAIAPDIADFHNSRGMLRIAQRQGNVIRLEEQFKKATELSEGFALAYHGLGCVELLRNPEADIDTSKYLQKAHNDLPDASLLFAANESAYESSIIDQLATLVAASAEDAEAGMAIKREVKLGELTSNYQIRQDALDGKTGVGRMVAEHVYQLDQTARSIGRELSDMTVADVETWARKNPSAAQIGVEAVHRAEQSPTLRINHAIARGEIGVGRVVDRYLDGIAFQSSGLSVTVNAAHLREDAKSHSDMLSQQVLDRAVKLNIMRGAETYNSSVHGNGVTIQKFAPGPAINAQQGGATMDKRRVVWGTTQWPFHPLFGLLYMPPANNDLQYENGAVEPADEGAGEEGQP